MFSGGSAVLFIDEIHRFSKSQQDSLLGAVEKGTITLIGATTENPSFEVISALLSRCQTYILKHHTKEDLEGLLNRALSEDIILKPLKIKIKETEALLRISGGDARKLLNILEIAINALPIGEKEITNDFVLANVQQKIAMYDKNGEQHYDIASALIKSIRGSDPNADPWGGEFTDADMPLLYNLDQDPSEQFNLADKNVQKVNEMMNIVNLHIEKTKIKHSLIDSIAPAYQAIYNEYFNELNE